MSGIKRKIMDDELEQQARAAQVVAFQLQQLRVQRDRERALAEQVFESQLEQIRQQNQMQAALPQNRVEPMRLPPRDAQIPLLTSEKKEYDEASYAADFHGTGSGSGTSAPSFIVEQYHNMPYKEQLSSMREHEEGRKNARSIRRRNSFQGNKRTSPTRALMSARELSELLIKEDPYQEKAEYRSEMDKHKYGWGKTKRKKRRKLKTKRKKHTKKHKHKKRKSTLKK